MFVSERGQRLDHANLRRRFLKPAARAAGVGEWVGFHTFRHTCATLLFRNGRNAKQVQKYLGHSGPGFTLRTYVHLLDDDLDSPDFMEAMTSEGGQQMGNTTRRNGARSEPSEGLGIPQDKPKTLGSSLPV